MSNPSHNDRMELEIFDSFSKTVMRNTGRNIASASKIIRTNEAVSTDTVQYILKTQGEREIYPSEHIINDGNESEQFFFQTPCRFIVDYSNLQSISVRNPYRRVRTESIEAVQTA